MPNSKDKLELRIDNNTTLNIPTQSPRPRLPLQGDVVCTVAMDIILQPVRIATSKSARQTYLNTALLLVTFCILLGVASFAYVLFYMSFIPQIGIERAVHLQFLPPGHVQKPYAFVSLDSSIVSQQAYSIQLSLSLPRSPPNTAAGNFMIDLKLLPPSFNPTLIPALTNTSIISDSIPDSDILFWSRRPALLTYHAPIVRLSKQLASLPWLVLNWRREAEILEITLAEAVQFAKGSRNVPETVYLELETRGTDLQVYSASLHLRARFSGLRWIMYNHRILSFFVGTGAFWGAEVMFAVISWLLWNSLTSSTTKTELIKTEGDGETDGSVAVKAEEGDMLETDDADLSDTPRNFPTYGRQPPLYYAPKMRMEVGGEDQILNQIHAQPLEADDESEEPVNIGSFRGGRSDSGIGTSFSEGPRSEAAKRRRSREGS